jgi:D-alanine-D-alanine ligase
MSERKRVALIYGGRSQEHEVSLVSAGAVASTLTQSHDVTPLYVDTAGQWFLQPLNEVGRATNTPVSLAPTPTDRGRLRPLDSGAVLAEPEVYFPLIHGTYGEDGTLQGLLELADVAYVGSGVLASAAGMDKAVMKALFGAKQLPQVDYVVLSGRDGQREKEALEHLGLPAFVKPANLGSSVGISKVKTPMALGAALDEAFALDFKVLIEAAVTGREIEVSVLGNDDPETSLPGEIVPDRDFYDYDSKYSSASQTKLLIPAPLPPDVAARAQALARAAFSAIGASGLARVDFFLDQRTDRLLVNEINTIPGFTAISMFPKLWQATGVPYDVLLERLLALACQRRDQRQRRRTTRMA